MEQYYAVNQMLVSLFNDAMDMEQKAIMIDEFKDISINDMHIIEVIGMEAPKNMTTIAGQLKITVGTLTIAINNLVKKGYVERIRGEKDRRVVFISLAEKGKRAYEHHARFHEEMSKAIMERLDEQEVKVFFKALKNICQYFKENE